jgi:hypothetical protein
MQYRVMRDCCTSGQCFDCQHLPVGTKIRVEHISCHTQIRADTIAQNWKAYNAKVEPIGKPKA